MIRSILSIALLLCVPAFAWGHPLADGVIERGVEVQVQADHVHVKYLLGMNDNTLAAVIAGPNPPMDAQRLAQQPELVDAARTQLANGLPAKLTVEIDGKQLSLALASHQNTGGHHLRFEFIYTAKLPAGSQSGDIEVTDHNFADFAGSHRVALKGRLGATVYGATTEPILARIPREEWASLSDEQKLAATTVSGKFAVAGK